jgi:hypothetical protein
MTIWAFILILCCPFGSEHRLTWQTEDKDSVVAEKACRRMHAVVTKEIKGFGVKAVVGECKVLVE